MFDKNDPAFALIKYVVFLVMVLIGLNIIIVFASFIKNVFKDNLSVIIYGITGIVLCGLCFGIHYFKKEYDRIAKHDFDRVKRLLSQYLNENHFTGQDDGFVLVEEEKGLTRKDFLKRCFDSYHVDLKVFVPDGKLLCTVKVYKEGIRVKNVERLSHMNYRKELAE
ncbi:hypothetical protein [Bacillus sp. NPDC094106]|uniref:hypothetical protein n=1 Tax=Bacillus sp. NPDC094106 TaxID=3363949 RepID=UPI00382B5424